MFIPKNNVLFNSNSLNIGRAPEPSDINWSNCEKPHSHLRGAMIWVMTFFILYSGYSLISFVQTLEFVRTTEGVLTSIILQLFNRVIWLEISWLVTYENNTTKTNAIISLMKKSMIAQVLNIIITPVISKFVNDKEIYGNYGLSGMALTYQFVMVLMMIFYYILNPLYLMKYFGLKIACIRNEIIRRYCPIISTKSEPIREMK